MRHVATQVEEAQQGPDADDDLVDRPRAQPRCDSARTKPTRRRHRVHRDGPGPPAPAGQGHPRRPDVDVDGQRDEPALLDEVAPVLGHTARSSVDGTALGPFFMALLLVRDGGESWTAERLFRPGRHRRAVLIEAIVSRGPVVGITAGSALCAIRMEGSARGLEGSEGRQTSRAGDAVRDDERRRERGQRGCSTSVPTRRRWSAARTSATTTGSFS